FELQGNARKGDRRSLAEDDIGKSRAEAGKALVEMSHRLHHAREVGAALVAQGAGAAGAGDDRYAAPAEIEISRCVIEMLVGVDEVFDFRTAGELQRFLDLVDAPDVG